MSKIKEEFTKFISRGNVIDLAVAVVIGGVFGKIVTSLVEDIIMPPIGFLISGISFSDIKLILRSEAISELGEVTPAIVMNIGNFFQTIINFLLVTVSIFIAIKLLAKARDIQEKKDASKASEESTKTTKEVELLTEIRDLLKESK